MPIKLLSRVNFVRSPSVSDLFSPVCWYDASDTSTVTLSGSTASTWINKGTLGTAYNLTQATASRQPTYTATKNGLKLLTFDGSDDQMLTTQVNTVTHIFVASAWSAAGASSSNYKGFLSSNAYDWHGQGSTVLVASNLAATWVRNQPTESTSQLDGSNFVNISNNKWSSFSIYSINLQSGYTGGFSGTGTSNGDGRQFQGDYGEIIVYQTTYLTSAQIEIITGYLANKWGSTALLPSNQPYKSQSPFLSDTYYPLIFSAKRPTPTTVTNYKVSTEQIVTDGLVLNLDAGYARSYPGSGTTWYDASGRGNNGTLVNGPTYSSANGGSIVFDGTNDYVTIGPSSFGAFGTGDFTIEWWEYILAFSSGYFPVFHYSEFGATSNFNATVGIRYESSSFMRTSLAGTTYDFSSGVVTTLNVWRHCALVRSSGTLRLYQNGVANGTTFNAASSNVTSTGNSSIIGGAYFGGGAGSLYSANGYFSNIRVYNGKGFTASEVLRNYNLLKDRYGL